MDRERLDPPAPAQTSARVTKNDPIKLAEWRAARQRRAARAGLPPIHDFKEMHTVSTAESRRQAQEGMQPAHRERLDAVLGETVPMSVHTKAVQIIRGMRKAGRAYHGDIVITDEIRERVALMATAKIPQKDIAAVLGIAVPTLRRYFLEELEMAPVVTNALVGDKALQMALDGQHENMTRFWLRVNGWKDKPDPDTKNSNNGQVNVMIHVGGVDANL